MIRPARMSTTSVPWSIKSIFVRTPIVRLPRQGEMSTEKITRKREFGTFRIYFTGQLESVRVCEISVCSGDGKDDGVWFCDVLENHVPDLFLDVLGLVPDRDFCKTREIDEGEGEDVGGEDSEVDGSRGDSGVRSGLRVRFSDDFIAYFAKVVKLLAWEV